MKHLHAILLLIAAAFVARGQDTNFAFRVPCEVQTADTDSLPELVWLQGSTPLIQAVPMRLGKALAADSNTFTAGTTALTTNNATFYDAVPTSPSVATYELYIGGVAE